MHYYNIHGTLSFKININVHYSTLIFLQIYILGVLVTMPPRLKTDINTSLTFSYPIAMSARDRGSSRRQSTSHRRSSRRKDKQKKHHLTQEDIDYIKKNTRYDESEIREWYKGFKVRFDQKIF